jgi:catechol 2,3-dioxygenase-like lactoylglutathione lyase family enzyme
MVESEHVGSSVLPTATFFSVAIVVSDRKKSVEWYTRNLGLDLVQDMGHWVTVGRKGIPGLIHLCQTSEVGIADGPEPGLTGIELKLPGDFQAACAALAANGVKFRKGPVKSAFGWWAGILDPDGNELTLMPADQ